MQANGNTDADVIGLAAIGNDQVNLVKQAGAFRLGAGGKQALASFKATRSLPVENFGRPTTVGGDGRVISDLTLYRVENHARRHGSSDYYEEICTLPAVEALPPINPVCEHAS